MTPAGTLQRNLPFTIGQLTSAEGPASASPSVGLMITITSVGGCGSNVLTLAVTSLLGQRSTVTEPLPGATRNWRPCQRCACSNSNAHAPSGRSTVTTGLSRSTSVSTDSERSTSCPSPIRQAWNVAEPASVAPWGCSRS
jgi:hypothetical protein